MKIDMSEATVELDPKKHNFTEMLKLLGQKRLEELIRQHDLYGPLLGQ